MNYKQYIEQNIFPIYSRNDKGHDINHINHVITKILEYNKLYELDEKLLYIAAAYHDIAHHIDKDNHEILSAKLFLRDKYMNENLTKYEMKIIYEAIADHRTANPEEPRSMYGKLLVSADKSMSFEVFIYRTHSYSLKHFSNYTFEEMIKRAYDHLMLKYSSNGCVKTYVENDTDLIKFKTKTKKYENNYQGFIKEYNKVINN